MMAVLWARDQVASGRFVALLERHPDRRGTATVIFYLARYYEIFNDNRKALEHYQRITKRYPKSPRYGEEAQFGLASSYERLKKYPEAIAEYEKYLELYPNGRYRASVATNITILSGR